MFLNLAHCSQRKTKVEEKKEETRKYRLRYVGVFFEAD